MSHLTIAVQSKIIKQLINYINVGRSSDIYRLVNKGVDINLADEFGYTPLHYACIQGRSDIVKYFLAKGADIEARSDAGVTPIYGSVQEGSLQCFDIMVYKGANIHAIGNRNETILHGAVCITPFFYHEKYEIVKAVLDYGVDPFAKLIDGQTALDVAKNNEYDIFHINHLNKKIIKLLEERMHNND